ncbi:hypothetical protein DVH05_013411 [Phytophthora capsici]|nr:hypothetical protein DVH05_013411 [Phytophthora capsici]
MAPKPKLALPACGYIVVYLGLSDETLTALKTEAKAREYIPVFEKVGGECHDAYRKQSRVKRASGAVSDLKIALASVTSCLDPGWVATIFSFMHSAPGGNEQESHQDYPAHVIDQAKKKKRFPASMVFSIDEGTKLRVYDGCTETKDEGASRVLTIPVGFCVIFRGDLIHNGMPYSTANYRIHCYLTYKWLKWEPDIVTNVLPPHFVCQYCGVKLPESNLIRQHRRYCSKNPDASKNELTRRAPPKTAQQWTCNVCGKMFNNDSSYRTHLSRGHLKKRKTDQ